MRWSAATDCKEGEVVEVEAVARRRGEFAVYNLEVTNIHSYYVSPLAILVHNQCGGAGGAGGGAGGSGFAPGGKAPDQVTQGVRNVRGVYDPPNRSAPEPWPDSYRTTRCSRA